MSKIPRCNYCRNSADVWFEYQGYIASRRAPKHPVVTVSACNIHKDCANFLDNLKHHPEARLIHKDRVTA